MSFLRILHIAAFIVPFIVYTVLLLVPHPLPPMKKVSDDLMFLISKSAHAGGYAYLTAGGSLLFRSPQGRWGAVLFMMLHGVGTEIGQTYVPNRHGCIQDVLIDWAGITLGFLVASRISRLVWSENRIPSVSAGSHFPAARPE